MAMLPGMGPGMGLYMEDEEERIKRLLAQQKAQAQQGSLGRREAQLANRAAQAQQMMSAPRSQGLSHGGLFVSSGWGGALSDAARMGLGAFQARKIRGEQEQLMREQEEADMAAAQAAARNLSREEAIEMAQIADRSAQGWAGIDLQSGELDLRERAQEASESQFEQTFGLQEENQAFEHQIKTQMQELREAEIDLDYAKFDFTKREGETEREHQERMLRLTKELDGEMAKAAQEGKLKDRKMVTFNAEHLGEGETINLLTDGKGNYFNMKNEPLTPEQTEQYTKGTEYSAGAQGTAADSAAKFQKIQKEQAKAAAAEMQSLNEEEKELIESDNIINTIASEPLADSTGRFNVKRLAGWFGISDDIAITNKNLKAASFEAMGPRLKTLGVNPTDNDVKLAMDTVPTVEDPPAVWIDWLENKYGPALLSDITSGTKPGLHDAYKAKLDQAITQARKNLEGGGTAAGAKEAGTISPAEFPELKRRFPNLSESQLRQLREQGRI